MLGGLMIAARRIARERGIDAGGYRVVVNTMAGAGQSVFHVHLHLLGGRPMLWPPG
jgi:histidine triad (HIT) family protein